MRTRSGTVTAALLCLTLTISAAPASAGPAGPAPAIPGTAHNVTLVGHDPLFGRGMNAALALYGSYIYVGNRTDASTTCPDGQTTTCPHPHPGVLVVAAADPSRPHVVGEIGPPDEGILGVTSREMRVWPQQKLLMVMNFRCSNAIHACPPGTDTTFPFDISFYSLADPVHPRLLSKYVPTSRAGTKVKPHEMFLWVDPRNPHRALLWLSTPTTSTDPARPNLLIVDVSTVADGGAATEVAEGNWNDRYPGAADPAAYDNNLFVHSMGVTADGRTTYLAMEAGEFLVLDTAEVAAGRADPALRLVTDPADRPIWGNPVPNCAKVCPNGHSAVPVPGRPLAVTTDEVYGTFTDPSHGCPWGWLRTIDVADPAHPRIAGEYRLLENQPGFCGSPRDDPATEQFASYSSHNPTIAGRLALVTWHSGGLQIVDLTNPRRPRQAGFYLPRPLPTVATEDPALSGGGNKVVFWSYPIIRDGLIYLVDIRNGLYILRYHGPHIRDVARIDFLEGNSNIRANNPTR